MSNPDANPLSAPLSPYGEIHKAFLTYLEKVERRNWEDKIFYNPNDVTKWMRDQPAGETYQNVVNLVSAVYEHSYFPEISSANQIDDYQLVFAVLLHPSVNCGNLIHIFRKCNISDHNLPFFSVSDLLKDLKTERPSLPKNYKQHDYDAVVRAFDRVRWAFCPAKLDFLMNTSFHEPCILPFLHGKVINTKGGTANVCHYKIQVDLVVTEKLKQALADSRHEDPKFGWCYEFAVKSYITGWEDVYKLESEAFSGVRSHTGVVQYLGEYHFREGESNLPNHNIILEYGQQDLDEYLADTFPPVLSTEIIAFWEGLFKVADTLKRLHQLDFQREDGRIEHFRGWHGDIKPDNILRVRGEYKLADFGFTKFEKDEIGKFTTHMLGNTQTYGAPECDNGRIGTATPHLQTIDTWSFGCVLSAVATWVILGSQAYDNYHQVRILEISELHQRLSNGKLGNSPSCSDAFHNGKKVLPAVLHWHNFLRNSARKSDTISCRILDLVDKEMLLEKPGERLNLEQLCEKLDDILILARNDLTKSIENMTLKKVEPDILKALLKLDKHAPAKATSTFELSKPTITTSDQASGQLPVPLSGRVRKSERLDKVILGKTANREEAIKSDLGLTLTDAREIYDSPLQVPVDRKKRTFEAQTSDQNPRHASNPSAKGKEIDIPEIRLTNDSPVAAREHASPFAAIDNRSPPEDDIHQPHRLSETPNNIASAINASDEKEAMQPEPLQLHRNSIRRKSNGVLTENRSFGREDDEAWEIPLHGGRPPITPRSRNVPGTGLGQFTLQAYGQQPNFLPPHASLTRAQMSPGTMSGYEVPTTPVTPTNNLSSLMYQASSLPAIYQEHVHLQRLWGDKRGTFSTLLGKVPEDRYLKNFISNRDIIFVVDNAASMAPHWDVATIVLVTLAMKIGPLDKDGLDLVYTIGSAHNIREVKGWDIPKSFENSMQNARRDIDSRYKTNMTETLQKIFDEYKNIRKKMTLIILTNGLWEGLARDDDVEKLIAGFITDLNRRLKKWEKRWFSIQFVSFGDDVNALRRLEKLDDDMPIDDDVIDTKPWSHPEVDKLILGSIRDGDDEDVPSPPLLSPAGPSSGFGPFPSSQHLQAQLSPKKSKKSFNRLSSFFRG